MSRHDRVVQTGPEGHVGPARYRDTATGAELVTTGRDALTYYRDGRQVDIPVEYGTRNTVAVYGVLRSWDDGSPLTEEQRADVRDLLVAVAERRRWKLDVVYDLVTGEKT